MTHDERTQRINDFRKNIGLRIRETRAERKLTQAQLAELVGVTDKQISHIEHGGSFPSLTLLLQLATVLDVSIQHLVVEEPVSAVFEDEWLYLKGLYYSLSKPTRMTLVSFAQQLRVLEDDLKKEPGT